jgi:hypothetical protein
MPFTTDRPVRDLFPENWVDDTARDIADNVQDAFLDSAERRTPLAQIPEAYHGDFPAWVEDRGGRKPGTLRDRWEKLPIHEYGDGRLSAPIENVDPIASFVEDDTQPHLIEAKRARVLRFPSGPIFRYAPRVWHPGTQGQHMLRDAEAETDARFEEIGNRTIDLRTAER